MLLNGAVLLFKTLDIFSQRPQQPFHMLRRHHHPAPHLGFGHARHDLDEIHHELCRTVCDDGQIGVHPGGLFFWKLNVEFALFFLI